MTDRDWMLRAACHGQSPSLFFPERGDSSAQIAEAVSFCHRCPVVEPCLSYAITEDLRTGIYAGLSAKQREKLRPRRQNTAMAERMANAERARRMADAGSTTREIAACFGVTRECVDRWLRIPA